MNERMTKRDTDGQAMMDCEKCKAEWTGKHGKPIADCTALYCRNRLLGRVVEYEDTGWTPKAVTALGELFNYALKESKTLTEQLTLLKHIRELAEADKDGRLVVLPCKVGDTVWSSLDGAKCARECKVDFVNIGNVGTTFVLSAKNGLREQYGVTATAFGKTVFLTREEAEKALEAMKDA
jgi:hypothetical protein